MLLKWKCGSVYIYTDGSAMNTVTNGGADVLIRFPGGQTAAAAAASVPTGKHCTKSEDPGFDPLAGQGELGTGFFCPSESTLVQTCLSLTPSMCTAHTQICVQCMLKIQLS